MIDLYYWATPNGHKVTMFLEEAALPYQIVPVDISKGDQFKPDFLKISPNNRMPAILDHDPVNTSKPVSVFESGAILVYLAERTGKFVPSEIHAKMEALQWLIWQMAGLGPMAGQAHHFRHVAQEKNDYSINRYTNETDRLFGVLDRHLAKREFIAGGEYSIADMSCYPWTVPYEMFGISLDQFVHLKRWRELIAARPATKRAYARGVELKMSPTVLDDESRKILYGQTARSVGAA